MQMHEKQHWHIQWNGVDGSTNTGIHPGMPQRSILRGVSQFKHTPQGEKVLQVERWMNHNGVGHGFDGGLTTGPLEGMKQPTAESFHTGIRPVALSTVSDSHIHRFFGLCSRRRHDFDGVEERGKRLTARISASVLGMIVAWGVDALVTLLAIRVMFQAYSTSRRSPPGVYLTG